MPQDVTIMRFVAEIPRDKFSKQVVLGLLTQLGDQLDSGALSVEDFMADTVDEACELIDIVFDSPLSQPGRFIETEDLNGRSVGCGDWVDLGDGFQRLRVPVSSRKVVRTAPDHPWKDLDG